MGRLSFQVVGLQGQVSIWDRPCSEAPPVTSLDISGSFGTWDFSLMPALLREGPKALSLHPRRPLTLTVAAVLLETASTLSDPITLAYTNDGRAYWGSSVQVRTPRTFHNHRFHEGHTPSDARAVPLLGGGRTVCFMMCMSWET
jgi:hypothetical protein